MTEKKLAFVFPGQGSQSVGMMAALAADYPLIEETFLEAGDAFGDDLWDLVKNGPEEVLNVTRNTQPTLLTASIATWRVWQAQGGRPPDLLAGHSLGEYSALVAAGSLTFTESVKLVAERGRLMQSAVPEGVGAMAAILGLDEIDLETVCNRAAGQQVVSAANYNSPGQIVIAGHAEAVERAVKLAREAGAKRAIILPVSVPSHCVLMQDGAKVFAEILNTITITPPSIPVLHNVDVSSTSDTTLIKIALAEQLYKPVQWIATVETMVREGVTHIIECGPGKVLSGLIKRIDRSIETVAINDRASLEKALEVTQAL